MKNLLLVLSLILVFTVNLHSGTIYVKYNATGSNNGTSWTDACTSFQSALTPASSGDQIWVAKGTYKPSSAYDLENTPRYYHFRMINGVAIYGGFTGTETATSQRTSYGAGQANETILSGDLNDNGKDDNDCYHVFYHPSGLSLTNSAVLDGFTIKGGNANDDSPHTAGGGMDNVWYSSPSLTNCTFTSNSGGSGGGMGNYSSSSPTLTNCTFSSNSAEYGGGMDNFSSSSPTLTNCTFTSNSASNGGGMNNHDAPTLNNCIIWGNEATWGDEFAIWGGGTTTLNYSCYRNAVYTNGGTFDATNNNITSDPKFVGSSINPTHPYSIPGNSPCVDAGLDSYNGETYDIRGEGYPRKLGKNTGATGRIDMGAYEYKLNADLLPVELTSFAASANGAAVTLNWQTATEVNNYGFEIQRLVISDQLLEKEWEKVGFVEGSGTTNAPKKYSFTDNNIPSRKYSYRLKQIDRNGAFKYSQETQVTFEVPKVFALSQNYPDPFNPTTTIQFTVPSDGETTLKVYNALGQEVATLFDGVAAAGEHHQATFNASNLASGIYFSRLEFGGKMQAKKMLLLK